MLVYVRDTEIDNVLLPIDKTPVPPHLERFFTEEARLVISRAKELQESVPSPPHRLSTTWRVVLVVEVVMVVVVVVLVFL